MLQVPLTSILHLTCRSHLLNLPSIDMAVLHSFLSFELNSHPKKNRVSLLRNLRLPCGTDALLPLLRSILFHLSSHSVLSTHLLPLAYVGIGWDIVYCLNSLLSSTRRPDQSSVVVEITCILSVDGTCPFPRSPESYPLMTIPSRP